MPRIQANRDSIDDRFSVLGFTVRTESPLFEVAVATDPQLFRPENRGRRARANFYSSRAQGVIRARRGEAVYLLPPDVLSNFIGQPRLYFGLATYRESTRGAPDFVQAPSDGSMYIGIGQLTERGLRRSALSMPSSSYGQPGGHDPSLDWGGDVTRSAPPAAAPASPAPPAASPGVATAADYDDGYGYLAPAPAPTPAPAAAPAPASADNKPLARAQEVLLRAYNGDLLSQLRLFAETAQWIAGVSDTRALPHSAICHLLLYNGQTLRGRATGFYIGPKMLMTNAHVVTGTTRMVVIPGKNGAGTDSAHEPFGRFSVDLTAATSRPHPRYDPATRGRAFDMALVRVPTAAPNGRWLAPVEELTQSRPEGVAVCGYSAHSRRGDLVATIVHATLDPEKQHVHRGYVRTVADDSFSYDVQELAGSSGSPVYWIEGGAHPRVHVVGVNAGPNDDVTNEGCRITPAKVQWIQGIAAEWGQGNLTPALELEAEAGAEALAIPLDPGAGGRSIGTSALQPADVIVSTTRAFVSRIIRLGTVSPVSHVMIYVGDGKVIEAVGHGVREIPLADAIQDAILAVAYRVPGLDAAAAARVVAHARSRVGNPYNFAGVAFQGFRILNPLPAAVISAVGSALRVEPGQAGAVYCSELVLESFERGGHPLGTRPSTSTPDGVAQLARSRWTYVGHLKAEDVPMGIQLGMEDATGTGTAVMLAARTPPRVTVRDRRRRPARFPPVRVLSAAERALVVGLVSALSPTLGAVVAALRALPSSHRVSVAVGPSAGVGFLIGGGVGAGVIFAPDGQIGVYGGFDLRGGLIDSASVELQVSIVQGGIEEFNGIGFSVAAEVDLGVSVSVQALFSTAARFQGVSFGLGVGLGVEPFEIYIAMQGSAAQALALTYDSVEEAPAQPLAAAAPVSLPAPPADVIQQPLQAETSDDPDAPPVAQAQAAPVLIPIAAAVVGATFTRLLSNTGDVSWELDQMNGLKHPNDTAPSPLPAFQDGPVVRLVDWPSSGGLVDSISAGFEVRWQHNGQSLGNVQISNVATNDAVGWGLTVKAQIMNDSIVYPRNAPRFAALRIRFDYRFTRSIGSDALAWRELHLFGNGTYNLTGGWTQ